MEELGIVRAWQVNLATARRSEGGRGTGDGGRSIVQLCSGVRRVSSWEKQLGPPRIASGPSGHMLLTRKALSAGLSSTFLVSAHPPTILSVTLA